MNAKLKRLLVAVKYEKAGAIFFAAGIIFTITVVKAFCGDVTFQILGATVGALISGFGTFLICNRYINTRKTK